MTSNKAPQLDGRTVHTIETSLVLQGEVITRYVTVNFSFKLAPSIDVNTRTAITEEDRFHRAVIEIVSLTTVIDLMSAYNNPSAHGTHHKVWRYDLDMLELEIVQRMLFRHKLRRTEDAVITHLARKEHCKD